MLKMYLPSPRVAQPMVALEGTADDGCILPLANGCPGRLLSHHGCRRADVAPGGVQHDADIAGDPGIESGVDVGVEWMGEPLSLSPSVWSYTGSEVRPFAGFKGLNNPGIRYGVRY